MQRKSSKKLVLIGEKVQVNIVLFCLVIVGSGHRPELLLPPDAISFLAWPYRSTTKEASNFLISPGTSQNQWWTILSSVESSYATQDILAQLHSHYSRLRLTRRQVFSGHSVSPGTTGPHPKQRVNGQPFPEM